MPDRSSDAHSLPDACVAPVWLGALASHTAYISNHWRSGSSFDFTAGLDALLGADAIDAVELERSIACALLFPKLGTASVVCAQGGIDSLICASSMGTDGRQKIVLALRGTDVAFGQGKLSSVWRYFSEKYPSFEAAWSGLEPLALDLMRSASGLEDLSQADILISGHSYGGSLASHAQRSLGAQGLQVRAVTFGSPGTGQSAWASTGSPSLDVAQLLARPLARAGARIASYPARAFHALCDRAADALLGIPPQGPAPQDPRASALEIINPADPVPLAGSWAGNQRQGATYWARGPCFEPGLFRPGNHSMDRYMRHSGAWLAESNPALARAEPAWGELCATLTERAALIARETLLCLSLSREQARSDLARAIPGTPEDELDRLALSCAVGASSTLARTLISKGALRPRPELPEVPENYAQACEIIVSEQRGRMQLISALAAFRLRSEWRAASSAIGPATPPPLLKR